MNSYFEQKNVAPGATNTENDTFEDIMNIFKSSVSRTEEKVKTVATISLCLREDGSFSVETTGGRRKIEKLNRIANLLICRGGIWE